MMKIWILISNAVSARVLSTEGRDSPLRLERQITHVKSQAATTDQPGRGRTGKSGHGMFSMPSRTSGKDLEGEDFAHELSHVLRAGLEQHHYERLAMLAPPHFLGLLTKSIGHKVSKHVRIRQDSDYTHVLTNLLPGLLSDVRQAVETEEPLAKSRVARQRGGRAATPIRPHAPVEPVGVTSAEKHEDLAGTDAATLADLSVENLVKKAMGKKEWSQEQLLDLARQEGWSSSKITGMIGDGQSFTRRRHHHHYLYAVMHRGRSGRRTAR